MRHLQLILTLGLVCWPVTVRGAGTAGLYLTNGPDGAQSITSLSGESWPIALPEKGRLDVVIPSGDGWFAAGGVVHDGMRELLLYRGDEDGVVALPAPPDALSTLRGNAVPLFDGETLAGLAWLEGERSNRLSVRAARWLGSAWGPPETIASEPHSRVALTGTVLEDGRWLLIWCESIEEYDEIVYALRDIHEWRRPERLHPANDVPDIVPTVTATRGGGAIAAWSHFDGNDYRLALAPFDGTGWGRPISHGERGSLYAQFLPGTDPLLLYRTVEPASWTVLELDEAGRPGRRAVFPIDLPERPVATVEAGGPRLAWPSLGHDLEVVWTPVR